MYFPNFSICFNSELKCYFSNTSIVSMEGKEVGDEKKKEKEREQADKWGRGNSRKHGMEVGTWPEETSKLHILSTPLEIRAV